MFSRFQKPIAFASRQFSTSTARNKTVAVMGASGGMLKVDLKLMLNYWTKLRMWYIIWYKSSNQKLNFTGIGQPLSMLLKLNPAVTKLNLYDIVHTPGVASDLSHCETKSTATGFVGELFCSNFYVCWTNA